MSSLASAEQEKSLIKPLQKMEGHFFTVYGILRLPGGRRIISCSWPDGSLRVWDLESGMQVGEAWKDEGSGAVRAIALSPDGKKVASGSDDGAVRLWDIDTGKVIRKWTGHTKSVRSVCWSSDGGRVVSGSYDGTFRVWDVENGKTSLGPIKTECSICAVCYSPDCTMIATGTPWVQIWDANTGELLKTLYYTTMLQTLHLHVSALCLAWTSDGKTLIAGGFGMIWKFDTATWTQIAILANGHKTRVNVNAISLSPNERILASVWGDKTIRLWNLETNQPIGPPLHHENMMQSAAFSVDGKFLATGCFSGHHIYRWDVSAIIKKAGLDNLLCDNRNYHARKKTAASSSRPPNTHVIQQPSGVTQGTPSSPPQSPATATASASLPAHSGTAVATGTPSHLDITITQAGCWTRFLLWISCVSTRYTDGQH